MSHSNPVVAYLQRHGSAKSAPVPLTIEYHLTSDSNPSLYRAPSTNESYPNVSGDFNPIHTNPYFVTFASLPGTITHGMFTTGSTATRWYVETVKGLSKACELLPIGVIVAMVGHSDEEREGQGCGRCLLAQDW